LPHAGNVQKKARQQGSEGGQDTHGQTDLVIALAYWGKSTN